MAASVANLFRAGAEIIIRVGPVGVARFSPPVFVPVARIGRVSVQKGEISLRFRIVCGLVRQIDFLAVLFLDLLIHMGHINRRVLVGRGRREEHEEVVAFLRGDFGGGSGGKINQIDIVHHDVGVVLLSPFLGEFSVEPGIVSRDEMAPLNYFQRLLLRQGALGKEKSRPDSGGKRSSTGELDEFSAGDSLASLFCHGNIPPSNSTRGIFSSSYSTEPNCLMSSGPSFFATFSFPCTCTRICSTTSGFASVVISPTSSVLEIAARTRRMIFPERVLGMSGTTWTAFGRAIFPIIVSISRVTFSPISLWEIVTPGFSAT